jgi:carbon storage regulator
VLVLSRKRGEKLLIGDVAVTVLEVQGNRVRVGIEAPADVAVLRAELATGPATGRCGPAVWLLAGGTAASG